MSTVTVLHKNCKTCGSPMTNYRHREKDGGCRNSWYCPKCQSDRLDAQRLNPKAVADFTRVCKQQGLDLDYGRDE